MLFTKHSPYPIPAGPASFSTLDSELPSQTLLPAFIALKLTSGPQTQELIFWPVGGNEAVNHCTIVLLRLVCKQVPALLKKEAASWSHT